MAVYACPCELVISTMQTSLRCPRCGSSLEPRHLLLILPTTDATTPENDQRNELPTPNQTESAPTKTSRQKFGGLNSAVSYIQSREGFGVSG